MIDGTASEGFVYYSYGESYLDETRDSIRTLLEHSPTARVCLMTDQEGKAYWERVAPDIALDAIVCMAINRTEPFCFFRTTLCELSPYHKTIALDSDTYIAADIRDLFDLLDTFDVVTVPDEAHPAKGSIVGLKGGYAALSYYNPGVLLFRKSPATQRFFECWKEEYRALAPFDGGDQGSLVRALVKTAVRFITLPQEYNLRLTNKCVSFQGRVKIVHSRARHPQRLMKMLNNIQTVDRGSRVWHPTLQRVISATAFYPYGRLLKLLNWDEVQWAACRKEPRTSVLQNIQALIRARTAPRLSIGSVNDRLALDAAVCDYLIQAHAIQSFFGYGSGAERCAPYFESRAIDTWLLHGSKQDVTHARHVRHDWRRGPYRPEQPCDVAWYGEDRPSITPRDVPFLIDTLTGAAKRLLILTHGLSEAGKFAQLGFDGPWVQLIHDRGFYLNPSLSLKLRGLAQSHPFQRTGLVFERVVI